MRLTWIALLLAACPKEGAVEAPVGPVVGWAPVVVQNPDGTSATLGECYHPVDFEAAGVGDRRIERQKALEAMKSQWLGARGDGVSFDAGSVEELETVLLGKPELIEMVATVNLQQCEASRRSGSSSAWSSWIHALPGKLMEGECKTPPLYYTLFDYLDVGKSWQIPAYVCAGDRIQIRASSMDYYQVREGGPWINAAGDPSVSTHTPSFPCNMENCFLGQLVMRFTSDDHVETVVPVGLEAVWEAPAHGRIEVMVNDDDFNDNRYKKEGSVIHHASIEYSPAE